MLNSIKIHTFEYKFSVHLIYVECLKEFYVKPFGLSMVAY